MKIVITKLTIGSLLHDIGKVMYRASISAGSHSQRGYESIKQLTHDDDILNCIRFHHRDELQKGKDSMEDDELAYIVYSADNIAAGVDRRKDEGTDNKSGGFRRNMPLASIYNMMNNNPNRRNYPSNILGKGDTINFPEDGITGYEVSFYQTIYQELFNELGKIDFNDKNLNAILELLEVYLTYVPSSTEQSEVADISLYDHVKVTAAVACCMYFYYAAKGEMKKVKQLANSTYEQKFKAENAFLMFSCDLSGIQSFIYTTSGEGALKTLRARSLYLEILLEHLADEILTTIGLSRANLIYTGGGHAYLLLPNTEECQDKLRAIKKRLNHWFIENFGNDLYLAMAWTPCSGNDLINEGDNGNRYREIYSRLAAQLSLQKNTRYSAEEILWLNQADWEDHTRECKECRRSAVLQGKDTCSFCDNIKQIARLAIDEQCYFSVLKKTIADMPALPLPSISQGTVYLSVIEKDRELPQEFTQQFIRQYSKNNMVFQSLTTKIWMGDYHQKDHNQMATFATLAESSQGVKRLGVLRADVDNLGQAFVSGFRRRVTNDDPQSEYRYLTLSRTAALSRSLSLFFKYHINQILKGTKESIGVPFHLANQKEERAINVIYSGGDDLFLVGAWDDILEAAVDINDAFQKYTQGALTLSAGIGLFNDSYPLARMAEETGELEQKAKSLDKDGAKNAIALFGEDDAHVYHWNVFKEKVVGEKLNFLRRYFKENAKNAEENTAAMTFIYQLLYLLRENEKKINLARFAYVLGKRKTASREADQLFNATMYTWYLNDEDRRQLITAIYLYIYLNRK